MILCIENSFETKILLDSSIERSRNTIFLRKNTRSDVKRKSEKQFKIQHLTFNIAKEQP